MVENSKIEWTDHTFSPWVGCTKVSPACDNCYAEERAKRYGQVIWGNNPRNRTSPAYWVKPMKWHRAALKTGKRVRVFCASLSDVFDNRAPAEWREDLWAVIRSTWMLDWMLLTKRPQNIREMTKSLEIWSNVWIGTTIENQDELNRRLPFLLETSPAIRFLSCEPLLGPLEFRPDDLSRVGLVIAGGESGGKARETDIEWFRSLRDQCTAAGVPYFHKQMTKKALIPDEFMIRQWPT